MTTPNKALLKRTLQHIEEHPEEWNQDHWITLPGPSCGTAYCFGGWAVVLSGYQISHAGYVTTDQLPDEIIYRLDALDRIGELPVTGRWADPGDVASILLGVPLWDDCPDCLGGKHHLFCVCNRFEDLQRIVAELCGEAPEAVS